MNDFTFYFRYGWEHIISINALDHILFIIALAAIYAPRDWKKVVILVTAFTIGHSLTLALSVYDIVRFNSKWVEFLIPITIIITAGSNLLARRKQLMYLNYLFALFFGLIHGMGFANSIRFMLADDQSIGIPLLSFNLGIEVGQILVVAVLLGVYHLVVERAGISAKWWTWTLSVIAIGLSLYLVVPRWPL